MALPGTWHNSTFRHCRSFEAAEAVLQSARQQERWSPQHRCWRQRRRRHGRKRFGRVARLLYHKHVPLTSMLGAQAQIQRERAGSLRFEPSGAACRPPPRPTAWSSSLPSNNGKHRSVGGAPSPCCAAMSRSGHESPRFPPCHAQPARSELRKVPQTSARGRPATRTPSLARPSPHRLHDREIAMGRLFLEVS